MIIVRLVRLFGSEIDSIKLKFNQSAQNVDHSKICERRFHWHFFVWHKIKHEIAICWTNKRILIVNWMRYIFRQDVYPKSKLIQTFELASQIAFQIQQKVKWENGFTSLPHWLFKMIQANLVFILISTLSRVLASIPITSQWNSSSCVSVHQFDNLISLTPFLSATDVSLLLLCM